MSIFEDTIEATGSRLCVGLDVDPTLLPFDVHPMDFVETVIDATSDLVCAYKINPAFFFSISQDGQYYVEEVTRMIHELCDVPVILDGKFGDIENTNKRWAKWAYEDVDADAVTLNPLCGWDALKPFFVHGKRSYVLSHMTSGSHYLFDDASDIELCTEIAIDAAYWNKQCDGSIGLVVGTKNNPAFEDIVSRADGLPMLIPGIGIQGGEPIDAPNAIYTSSRSILYDYDRDASDWVEKVVEAALGFNRQVEV